MNFKQGQRVQRASIKFAKIIETVKQHHSNAIKATVIVYPGTTQVANKTVKAESAKIM